MRVISNKDGDLLSQFGNINEIDTPVLGRHANLQPQIRDKLRQKRLTDNHTDANKAKNKGFLFLDEIFGFCKTFKEVTKKLRFHLTF